MAPFASVAELAADMQVTFTAAQTAAATQALDIATQIIKTYTNQTIEFVDEDSVVLRRSYHRILLLPEVPVISVTSVNDGTLLVVDDDYEWTPAGVLKRLYGSWRENTTVVYDHGYATIPEDIVGVTLSVAARRMTGGSGGNVDRETMGPYTVSYREAVAALEPGEMDTLNRYRSFHQVPV